MNVSFFYFVQMMMLGLAGLLGVPMPMAVPPLPDQPTLLHVVPADALAFLAWNGTAEADPKSDNRAERLAAEPEVRAMVAQLRAGLVAMVAREGQTLAADTMTVLTDALQRPGCVFVRNLGPKPILDAGVVVQFGDGKAAAIALLQTVSQRAKDQNEGTGAVHADIVVDGVTFHSFGTPADKLFVGWAEVDGWVALAFGKETPAGIVAGLRGKSRGIADHADYQTLAGGCAVARPCTKSFVDLGKLRATFEHFGAEGRQTAAVFAALGLTGAKAIVAQAGLEGQGFVQRATMHAPAKDGLLGALLPQPLLVDELLQVPIDAQLTLAARLDGRKVEQALLQLMAAVTGEDVAAEYERSFVDEFPQQLGGARWREDLLDQIGDQLTVWNSPGQGGVGFTGLTGIVPLRDAKVFAAGFAKVMGVIQQQMPSKADLVARGDRLRRGMETLESFQIGEAVAHWVNDLDDHPFAPTWSVAHGHLIGSLLPQPVRAFLGGQPANPEQSLAKLPEIARRGAASLLWQWNAKDVVAVGYPMLIAALRTFDLEWQREGFDFDVADLPRPSVLLPHLGRELTTVTAVENGWQLQRTGTIPSFDPLTFALGVGLAAMVTEIR
jgi:hypothetical protein